MHYLKAKNRELRRMHRLRAKKRRLAYLRRRRARKRKIEEMRARKKMQALIRARIYMLEMAMRNRWLAQMRMNVGQGYNKITMKPKNSFEKKKIKKVQTSLKRKLLKMKHKIQNLQKIKRKLKIKQKAAEFTKIKTKLENEADNEKAYHQIEKTKIIEKNQGLNERKEKSSKNYANGENEKFE